MPAARSSAAGVLPDHSGVPHPSTIRTQISSGYRPLDRSVVTTPHIGIFFHVQVVANIKPCWVSMFQKMLVKIRNKIDAEII